MKVLSSNYYSLLRTSWRIQAQLFFQHSSLHGVKYIAENGRPFLERLLWFLCVNIGAVATLVIIVSLWEKFQTNPTITGLDTDFHKWDVPFPAITICEEVPSNLTVMENYVEELRKLQNVQNKNTTITFLNLLTRLSYKTLPLLKEFLEMELETDDIKQLSYQFMKPCDRTFSECTWKSESYNCCAGFFPIFTENGFCYTFNSRHYQKSLPSGEILPEFQKKFIKETDLKWSLSFALRHQNDFPKVPIYIHDSDEIPGVDTKPQHVWDFKTDKISFSVKETYTTEDARQLTIKQRHCVFDDEMKLPTGHVYTYSSCTRHCRMSNAQKSCGCVPHFYQELDAFRHCDVKELGCIIDNLGSIADTEGCGCQLGCYNTVYEVEKLNENDDPACLETEFVSWPTVRYKREVLFGWVDLLVSFGGIAGLFLGFSLLSGVELVYYFTMRAGCMVHMERRTLKKAQALNKTRKEYDFSMTPYFITRESHPKLIVVRPKPYECSAPFTRSNQLHKRITTLGPFGIEFLN